MIYTYLDYSVCVLMKLTFFPILYRAMLSICHLDAITVRDCSNTRGQGIATPNCIRETAATSVPIARLHSQGGTYRLYGEKVSRRRETPQLRAIIDIGRSNLLQILFNQRLLDHRSGGGCAAVVIIRHHQ